MPWRGKDKLQAFQLEAVGVEIVLEKIISLHDHGSTRRLDYIEASNTNSAEPLASWKNAFSSSKRS